MINRNYLILFTLSTAIVLLYFTINKDHAMKSEIYRIAIFEPASHPAIDEIVDGYITTLQKGMKKECFFKRYNANGNKTLLRSQAEDIIQQEYNLIMPIGADPTCMMHELTRKKNLTTPIVFTAVSDPISLGLIDSTESSGNNLTGIEEIPDYQDQINKLLTIKPETKSIMLVYDPIIKAGIHEIWAQEVKKITDNKNLELTFIKVFNTNEIQPKVQPFMHNADVIMIFTDHTTVSGIDSLINLCNRYGVTLYASDLNSGDKGAALSYGITQYDLGKEAALLSLKILNDNQTPSAIAIVKPSIKKLKLNQSVLKKQGLSLSISDLESIKDSGAIVI